MMKTNRNKRPLTHANPCRVLWAPSFNVKRLCLISPRDCSLTSPCPWEGWLFGGVGVLAGWLAGWCDPGLGSESLYSWAKLPPEQDWVGVGVGVSLWTCGFWSSMAFLLVYSSTLSDRTLATQTLIITTLSSCSSPHPSI